MGRQRHDGISGAICQLRAESLPSWLAGGSRAKRHGMCAPQGCRNFFLSPVSIRLPGRHRPLQRYELSARMRRPRPPTSIECRCSLLDSVVVSRKDDEAEHFFSMPHAAAITLPSEEVHLGKSSGESSGASGATSYTLYALDREINGRAFDLAGMRSHGEGDVPKPAQKPAWASWR